MFFKRKKKGKSALEKTLNRILEQVADTGEQAKRYSVATSMFAISLIGLSLGFAELAELAREGSFTWVGIMGFVVFPITLVSALSAATLKNWRRGAFGLFFFLWLILRWVWRKRRSRGKRSESGEGGENEENPPPKDDGAETAD